ncbi:DUF3027 domain-containing protein [Nocardia sp. NPDC058497]|uniref:DUF3027 domain-containing protein n=1 Tax=Nocardia sp. NPDC058497 TaxID=3346529 RepID=UPI003647613D
MSAVSVSESGVRPVLADAAEVARRALVELEPDGVGVHLGVSAEDETAATHRFEATLPGYRGWQWAVVVAAPPEADYATVSESALLPGPDALISPDFIPWEQRVRPGDLGPGDLLAPPADDPRLVPGYVANGDPVVDEVAYEVGLGRTQVLSLEGRLEAAQRWYTEFGPDTEMAKAAPSTCGLCGFYLPLAGALRDSFGVCGNAMGADGHVVHIEYGCGAHSDVVAPSGNGSPRYEAFDDHAVDFVEIVRPAAEAVETAEADAAAAAVESGQPVGSQETAEAEAADAAAAERAALAEGALPESADEVVAAELTSDAESAPVTETAASAPVAEAAAEAAAESGRSAMESQADVEAAGGATATGAGDAVAESASDAEAVAESGPAATEAPDSGVGAEPASDTDVAAETAADANSAGAEQVGTESASGAEAVAGSEGVGEVAEAAESGAANGAQADEAVNGESGAAGAGDSVNEHGSSVAR